MASSYTVSGKRTDICLFLNPDGTFERLTGEAPFEANIDRGRWHHADGEDVLRFEPDMSGEHDSRSDDWWLLSVATCEDSNCLMVLRWVATRHSSGRHGSGRSCSAWQPGDDRGREEVGLVDAVARAGHHGERIVYVAAGSDGRRSDEQVLVVRSMDTDEGLFVQGKREVLTN